MDSPARWARRSHRANAQRASGWSRSLDGYHAFVQRAAWTERGHRHIELSGFAETAFPDERIAYRHAGPLYWVNSIFRRDSRISGRGRRFSRAYRHPERKQRRCDDDPAVEDPKRRVHADAVRH